MFSRVLKKKFQGSAKKIEEIKKSIFLIKNYFLAKKFVHFADIGGYTVLEIFIRKWNTFYTLTDPIPPPPMGMNEPALI